MATATSDLLTAGNIAKQLGVPDAKVKKALQQLAIKRGTRACVAITPKTSPRALK
jgi:predicted ArsR family transcriptional regulator